MLDNYIKWIKAHERLLFVLSALGVIVYVGKLWITRSYDTALAKNAVAQHVLAEQVSKNSELAKNVDNLNQQYQVLLGQVSKQNATLLQAIAARNQTVVKQQNTDQTLPLSDLAARQQSLVGLSTGIGTENGQITETPEAAIVVTQKLETLPVLEQNVTDLQTLAGNKDKQITSLGGVVNGLNGQVAGLDSQLVDADKACKSSIKLEVAKARKSWVKAFKIGVVTGFIAGYITGHRI